MCEKYLRQIYSWPRPIKVHIANGYDKKAQFGRPGPVAEESASGSYLPLCVSYKRIVRVCSSLLYFATHIQQETRTTGCVGGAEEDQDSKWAKPAPQANLGDWPCEEVSL